MEIFSTQNFLKEELIIQNNLTANDFVSNNDKGKYILMLLLKSLGPRHDMDNMTITL